MVTIKSTAPSQPGGPSSASAPSYPSALGPAHVAGDVVLIADRTLTVGLQWDPLPSGQVRIRPTSLYHPESARNFGGKLTLRRR